jgi:hypothetical protein
LKQNDAAGGAILRAIDIKIIERQCLRVQDRRFSILRPGNAKRIPEIPLLKSLVISAWKYPMGRLQIKHHALSPRDRRIDTT